MHLESARDLASRRSYRGFLWSFIALAAVMVIGTTGYRIIGGPQYSWTDCFYMTFITVATIGFYEVIDLSQSPAGRMFTVFIGFAGIGVSTFLLSAVIAFLLEGRINETLWRRKMEKHMHRLKNHYIICGVGRVGRNVANELAATRRPFVMIDEDIQSINLYLERHPEQAYLHADACDDEILQKAHIETASGVFAVTGDDNKNLVISLSAKQLNPAVRVVARCHEVRNFPKIRKAGADVIISPDFTGGLRIVSAMIRPHVVSFLDEMLKSEENLRVEEIVVPSGFPETPIGELNVKGRDHLIVALREQNKWVFNPDASHLLRAGTVMVIMATPSGRKAVEGKLGWV
jgi:voltage-gated potassium channel